MNLGVEVSTYQNLLSFFLLRSYNHISVAVGMLNKLCKCLNLHTEKILIHSLG